MTTKKGSKKSADEKKSAVTQWDKTIGGFAKAIGKSPAEVNEKLKDLVGDPSDEALALLLNEEDCETADIKVAFSDVPKAQLNKAIRTILRAEEESAETEKTEEKSPSAMVSLDILPKELSEESLLDSLKTGGVRKVNPATVTMAMRAALADRTGVFEVRKTLTAKMEEHATSLDEPVSETFFDIHNQVTQRKYGEIFEAIPGGASKFVSQSRINDFLRKVNNDLWPSLHSFHEQVNGWVESWQKGAVNPAAMTAAVMAMMSGGTGGALPPGIMAPPPTDGLRDAADAFIDKINRVFAGTGTIVASALGYDAKIMMDVLNNPELPAQIGAANKEQMLKILNINVSADVSRLANNAARYALSIMEFPKVTSGNEELTYITALFQLGAAIPWNQLTGISSSGIGSNQL